MGIGAEIAVVAEDEVIVFRDGGSRECIQWFLVDIRFLQCYIVDKNSAFSDLNRFAGEPVIRFSILTYGS